MTGIWTAMKAWVLARVFIITLGERHERIVACFQVRGLLYIATTDRLVVWEPDRGTLKQWTAL